MHIYWNKRKVFTWEKSSTPRGLVRGANVATVSFFWVSSLLPWLHVKTFYRSKPKSCFLALGPGSMILSRVLICRCIRRAFDWSDIVTVCFKAHIWLSKKFSRSVFVLCHLFVLVCRLVYLMTALFFFRVCFWKELVGTEIKWWCLNLFLKFYSILYLWYPFDNTWAALFVR